MYAFLWRQYAGLSDELKTASNDLAVYRNTGEALLRGELPYRDFFIEYPPGSVPAFVPPALFTETPLGYSNFLAHQMSLMLVAALALVALTAWKIRGDWSWAAPAAAFAAGTALLYPVAVTRFDPTVSLSLAVAAFFVALGGRYILLGYASLGFGAAAKLVPALATLPMALLARRAGGGLRRAITGFAVFFAVLGAFFVPSYLIGSDRFIESFTYHANRGLQLESVATSVLLKLGWIQGISFEYGAWDVSGRGVDLMSALSLPITGALLLVTSAVMYKDYRAGRFGAGKFPRYAAALILAFIIGSKVLSPQYMLWLLPLVPLAAGGLMGLGVSVVFLTACWATTQIFPTYYGDLMDLEPTAVNLLLFRNLLLVVLWILMLFLPEDSPSSPKGKS
ncbi:MAG: glycosyltransferase 87 family protein [Rubrobacteraceae bacterium]